MGKRRGKTQRRARVTDKQHAASQGSSKSSSSSTRAPAATTEEEAKQVKSLYLCILPCDADSFWWYVVKSCNDEQGPRLAQEISPVPELTKHPSPGGFTGVSVAVWESKIYCIGGVSVENYWNGRTEVQVFDTVTREWTQSIPMKQPRVYTTAVAVSGGIFVFGDALDLHKEVITRDLWAQYYEFNSGNWMNCAPPPQALYNAFTVATCALHELESTIYLWLHGGQTVFSYNYVTRHWGTYLFGPVSELLVWNSRPAVVGNILYWAFGGIICAYDLVKQERLGRDLLFGPPSEHPLSPDFRSLFYLGKHLLCCLALHPGSARKLIWNTFRIDGSSQNAGLVPVAHGKVFPFPPKTPDLFLLRHLALII